MITSAPKRQSKAEVVIDSIREIEQYIKAIPSHVLTFKGVEYEWKNGIYLRKLRELTRGQSFGEVALT